MTLQNKISSYIESVDEKVIYYILGGILFSVFLLDYFVLMRPQIASLSKIGPEIRSLSEDIKKAKDDILRSKQYELEVAKISDDVAKSNAKLKFKEEVPLILENISRMADDNGVKIDQIMPDAQDQQILLENEERRYYSLPIFIKATSGYHDFGRFLSELERGDIFFKVSSFGIISSRGEKKHLVEITLDAVVYEELKGKK
ncbi:MAG: type 4a pilus biogenesis protein PilO [Candidatus Omnitrophica bacterium]|nr:type 4a pilus biogenesis protein PilO [Candidatus Omnitrophota bacterium]